MLQAQVRDAQMERDRVHTHMHIHIHIHTHTHTHIHTHTHTQLDRDIQRLELQRMAVSFDVDRAQTFSEVFARLAPPPLANWAYETGAAYAHPASKG